MIRVTAKYTINDNEFNTVFTVFKPEYREKVLLANLSTQRKLSEEYDYKAIENGLANEYNGKHYMNSSWRAVFTGKAFNKASKHSLGEKDKITNVVAELTNEPYLREDGTKAYGNPTLRIIDFDIVENSGSKGIDTPPTVAKDEEELPF